MSVRELINQLEKLDQTEQIYILNEAGDGWMISELVGVDAIEPGDRIQDRTMLCVHSGLTTEILN